MMNFLINIIKESVREVQELDNALNKIKESNMSSWNGKVRCTDSKSDRFTKDKIYEIKEGCITADEGDDATYVNGGYANIKQLNMNLTSQFEEIKIPVLCELLGVVPNERFSINFKDSTGIVEGYHINEFGHLFNKEGQPLDTYISPLLEGEYQIIKLPFYQFSESELTTLKALYLNDYYYTTLLEMKMGVYVLMMVYLNNLKVNMIMERLTI